MNLQLEKVIGVSDLKELGCEVDFFSTKSELREKALLAHLLESTADSFSSVYSDNSDKTSYELHIYKSGFNTVILFSLGSDHRAFLLSRYDLYKEGHKLCCRLSAKLKFSDSLYNFLRERISYLDDSPSFINFDLGKSSIDVLRDVIGNAEFSKLATSEPIVQKQNGESPQEPMTREQRVAEILDKSSRKRLG